MKHQAAIQEFLSPVKKSRVIEEILDSGEHLRYEEQFHQAIVSAADNSLFSQMMALIWQRLVETFRITDRSAATLDKSNNNHREVFLAIKNRDGQRAKKAMLAVLQETERDLLKQEKSQVFRLSSSRNLK